MPLSITPSSGDDDGDGDDGDDDGDGGDDDGEDRWWQLWSC